MSPRGRGFRNPFRMPRGPVCEAELREHSLSMPSTRDSHHAPSVFGRNMTRILHSVRENLFGNSSIGIMFQCEGVVASRSGAEADTTWDLCVSLQRMQTSGRQGRLEVQVRRVLPVESVLAATWFKPSKWWNEDYDSEDSDSESAADFDFVGLYAKDRKEREDICRAFMDALSGGALWLQGSLHEDVGDPLGPAIAEGSLGFRSRHVYREQQ